MYKKRYDIRIDYNADASTPYLKKMAKILLIGQPVSGIDIIREELIISHQDAEKHSVNTYDYKSKLKKSIIVSYTNDKNGKRESIFFPTGQRLINQALRSLEKNEERHKPVCAIPEIDIGEVNMVF